MHRGRARAARTAACTATAALALAATAVAPLSPASAAEDKTVRTVRMVDDCDPTTFNAALGDGTCVGRGTTTFDDFLAELTSTGAAADWANRPLRLGARQGDPLRALNKGGEAHTFTRVAAFGGGCVEPINEILGLTPVPECSQTLIVDGHPVPKFAASLVLPGAARTVTAGKTGTLRYECLIHPWMRTIVHVRAAS